MSMDEWCDTYNEVKYAIEFDSKRQSGDSKNPAKYPL